MSSQPEIPKTCRAQKCVNPGPNFHLEAVTDWPVPEPGPDELLVKWNCTGLCLSDVYYQSEGWGFPFVAGSGGHEGAGAVVKLGSAVDSTKWHIGDRVGVGPIHSWCHQCESCTSALGPATCDEIQGTGVHRTGSFAEYTTLIAKCAIRIPENVPDHIAAVTMCSGVTIYTGLVTSGARPGDYVVIPGAGGGVGHQGLLYGKALGLRIIAVDTGKEKREMCLRLGAEAFFDFKEEDPVAEVLKLTGGKGAHAVVVTGGTAQAYSTAPGYLRKNGVLVGVGLPQAGTAVAGMDPCQLIFQRMQIRGSPAGEPGRIVQALEFANRGLIEPNIEVLPWSDFQKGWDKLRKGQVAGRVVVKYD